MAAEADDAMLHQLFDLIGEDHVLFLIRLSPRRRPRKAAGNRAKINLAQSQKKKLLYENTVRFFRRALIHDHRSPRHNARPLAQFIELAVGATGGRPEHLGHDLFYERFHQRVEAYRLIDKKGVARLFENFHLSSRPILLQISRLLFELRGDDIKQRFIKPVRDFFPVCAHERIRQQRDTAFNRHSLGALHHRSDLGIAARTLEDGANEFRQSFVPVIAQ